MDRLHDAKKNKENNLNWAITGGLLVQFDSKY